MLTHQIEFSKAIAEIYKPISGRMSDPNSIIPEGNPEGIEACEQYEAIVRELQETLQPELEMIESRVIAPAVELLGIIKIIKAVGKKRDHKQIDYDRHRTTLKKLQDKKDRTLKDDKAMYKAEGDVEVATQEYNYFNDLMKDELPKLFTLEREFIGPLFQSFYYMQLNVFYTLHEKMQSIDIGYFDLTKAIEAAFEEKRGDIQEQAEQLTIVHYKTTGGRRPGAVAAKYGNRPAIGGAGRPLALENGSSTYSRPSSDSIPPAYTPQTGAMSPYSASSSPQVGTSSAAGQWGAAAHAKAKPPPPKPKPGRFSGVPAAETVTALYDYEAQAEGDLSFSAGEVIEVVTRTDNPNEWWNGRVAGREGQFPGMCIVHVSVPGTNVYRQLRAIELAS
jgi:amphiphysin